MQTVWKIYTPAESAEKFAGLEQSLAAGDAEKVLGYLRDAQLLRSLIVMRGDNESYFDLLVKSFEFLLKKKMGAQISLENIEKEKLLNFVHEQGIPEQIMNELAHVAYHKRDENIFFKITQSLLENAAVENEQVTARALHDLGSWHGTHGEAEKAIKENKKAIELARAGGDRVVEMKAKFGLSYNKDFLKPGELAKDFLELAEALEKEGLGYDGVRAKLEAAKAKLDLAGKQEKKLAEATLLSAKDLALESLKNAKDLQYPNAEIRAREILSQAYRMMKDNRKVESYGKAAGQLRDKYHYKTGLPKT